MTFDALGHEEVVFLAWTVDSGGPKHHVGEVAECAEEAFGFELALSIGGVGLRMVGFADFFVRLLFAYGTEDAERTEVDEFAEGPLCGDERAGQVFGSFGVDGVEVCFVQAFRHACGMHHVVELVPGELLAQLLLAGQVQLQEVDAAVLQPFARTAAAHGSPDVHAFAERFFHDEAPDEAGSSCYQYFLHICLLYNQPAGAAFTASVSGRSESLLQNYRFISNLQRETKKNSLLCRKMRQNVRMVGTGLKTAEWSGTNGDYSRSMCCTWMCSWRKIWAFSLNFSSLSVVR